MLTEIVNTVLVLNLFLVVTPLADAYTVFGDNNFLTGITLAEIDDGIVKACGIRLKAIK